MFTKPQYRPNITPLNTRAPFFLCLNYCSFYCASHLQMVITSRMQNPVCKFVKKRSNQPNHGYTQIKIAKIGSVFAFFQKFGQGALLKLGKMLLHISLVSSLTIMTANSDAQTPKTDRMTSKTGFLAKILCKTC